MNQKKNISKYKRHRIAALAAASLSLDAIAMQVELPLAKVKEVVEARNKFEPQKLKA